MPLWHTNEWNSTKQAGQEGKMNTIGFVKCSILLNIPGLVSSEAEKIRISL